MSDRTPAPVHAYADDALGDHDAVGLAAAIRAGDVSRAEVLEAAIARAAVVDPDLRAIRTEGYDRARSAPEVEGPFSGVPTFVKDNTDLEGLPTCHGSAAFQPPHPAKATGAPARQLLSTGLVALGKSSLPEFGLTASTEYAAVFGTPATRNPWNTDHSVGASSGGSAALVAAGVVPIAHANDGGGSIRIPAAVNGLVGLKCTRARMLDGPGVRQLPVNLIGEGVVTRTVRDTAVYVAAAERFQANRKLPLIGLVEGPSTRRLRIGVVRADVRGRAVHHETEAVVNSAADVLAGLGHEVVEMRLDLDPGFIDDFKLYWAFLALVLPASLKASHRSSFKYADLDPFTKGLGAFARRRPHAIPGAVRRLRAAQALYDAHFADLDVMLSPVLAHPAPRIGEHSPDTPFEELFAKLIDYVSFTPVNNIGGGPGIAVPHGMYGNNLPGAVQLSGARGDERTLLELAFELEEASPFPSIRR